MGGTYVVLATSIVIADVGMVPVLQNHPACRVFTYLASPMLKQTGSLAIIRIAAIHWQLSPSELFASRTNAQLEELGGRIC